MPTKHESEVKKRAETPKLKEEKKFPFTSKKKIKSCTLKYARTEKFRRTDLCGPQIVPSASCESRHRTMNGPDESG